MNYNNQKPYKEIFEYDFKDFHVSEELKNDIKNNSWKYKNCDARIRMGKFYSDKEKEKYISESLARPLPPYDSKAKKRTLRRYLKK